MQTQPTPSTGGRVRPLWRMVDHQHARALLVDDVRDSFGPTYVASGLLRDYIDEVASYAIEEDIARDNAANLVRLAGRTE